MTLEILEVPTFKINDITNEWVDEILSSNKPSTRIEDPNSKDESNMMFKTWEPHGESKAGVSPNKLVD